MESVIGEILVVPFFGQGHLFPSMELCKHLSSHNFRTTLIIPSNLSSSIPSSLHHHPLVEIAEISSATISPPPPKPIPAEAEEPGHHNPFHRHHQELGQGIDSLLSARSGDQTCRPICVVIDVMMSWSKEIFAKFNIPAISFSTSGACSSAMEYAAWKARADDMKPGEIRNLPGLPEEMALAYSDLERRPRGGGRRPPPHIGEDGSIPAVPLVGMRQGPPGRGVKPRWLEEVEGSIALLINTSDDLEHLFINYVATQIGIPVWGVGPLLPEKYWESAGSLLHDREIRSNGRESNYTEDEVLQWLDSKPRRSVIYLSFGSEVGPTLEEYGQLANALEESDRPFIWVLQPNSGTAGPPTAQFGVEPGSDVTKEEGFYPRGLDCRVGGRGLIIRGWAPQLLILSHPSTGGFLSHSGWNSTVEAIGRGVPILGWPIRGDQYYNAKLVVCHLKVGCIVSTENSPSKMVKKDDILKGIERLMADEEVHIRASALQGKFRHGFPASSVAALNTAANFIKQQAAS